MKNEDNKIDEILNSIDKIERAQPRHDLFDDILNQIPQTKIIPLKKLYWIAAASLILISVNIATVTNTANNYSTPSTDSNTSLYLDYNLYE